MRVDAAADSALHERLRTLERNGVRVRIARARDGAVPRTYALVEGPAGVDPAEVAQRLPQARWYDTAILALAIEPLCADALPYLERALGGPGRPAGVQGAFTAGKALIVEFRPDVTPPRLVRSMIDVELGRFGGGMRIRLLAPLPAAVMAAIAADGLQACEIAPDRILESLLGLEHVE